MVFLVTGGTGLVGSHLIELLIDEGYNPGDIKVLVRPHSDVAFLQEKGVALCYGDLEDFASLLTALAGVNIVYHCAALLGERDQQATVFHTTAALGERAWERMWQVNFHGTENLLEAARLSRVDRFIYVSSVGVYGLLKSIPVTEEHPKHPLRPYAFSKLAAENKVFEYYHKYDLPSVILRPSCIIGERDRHITKRIMNTVKKRIIPLVCDGKARVSFVYAKDVARALYIASICKEGIGNAYNVDSFSASIRDVTQFFKNGMGVKSRIVNIPYGLAYLIAGGVDVFYTLIRRRRHPGLPTVVVRQLATDFLFDIKKIKTELKYKPEFTMQEAFQRSLRWQLESADSILCTSLKETRCKDRL